eukprot:4047523-Prymnesium_polylepis.1
MAGDGRGDAEHALHREAIVADVGRTFPSPVTREQRRDPRRTRSLGVVIPTDAEAVKTGDISLWYAHAQLRMAKVVASTS